MDSVMIWFFCKGMVPPWGSRGVGGVGGGGLLGGDVFAGRHPFGALKDAGKIKLVKKAHRDRHFGDGKGAALQQFAGFVDPVFGQVVDGAFAHVAHKDAVEVAAGHAHAFGHVVDGNIVGIVELDVFDGVQDVLAGRTGVVEAALAGLLHQGGDEEV